MFVSQRRSVCIIGSLFYCKLWQQEGGGSVFSTYTEISCCSSFVYPGCCVVSPLLCVSTSWALFIWTRPSRTRTEYRHPISLWVSQGKKQKHFMPIFIKHAQTLRRICTVCIIWEVYGSIWNCIFLLCPSPLLDHGLYESFVHHIWWLLHLLSHAGIAALPWYFLQVFDRALSSLW